MALGSWPEVEYKTWLKKFFVQLYGVLVLIAMVND
jgi:hypothetical protein